MRKKQVKSKCRSNGRWNTGR